MDVSPSSRRARQFRHAFGRGGTLDALLVFKRGLELLDLTLFFLGFFFVSVQSFRSTTAVIVKSCTSCITGCCTISDICNYEIIHCHLYKSTCEDFFILPGAAL